VELEERLSWLIGLAERMDVAVRIERLGGEGGGLCTLKSRRMLFVDADADSRTRYEATLLALGGLPELHQHHLPPIIAEDLERLQADGGG
jgi:hypothetical protein